MGSVHIHVFRAFKTVPEFHISMLCFLCNTKYSDSHKNTKGVFFHDKISPLLYFKTQNICRLKQGIIKIWNIKSSIVVFYALCRHCEVCTPIFKANSFQSIFNPCQREKTVTPDDAVKCIEMQMHWLATTPPWTSPCCSHLSLFKLWPVF